MREDVKSYLKKCGVQTIEDLSNLQVKKYFIDGMHPEKYSRMYAITAINAIERKEVNEDVVINSMKKSMGTGEMFFCGYHDGESTTDEYKPKNIGWVIEP